MITEMKIDGIYHCYGIILLFLCFQTFLQPINCNEISYSNMQLVENDVSHSNFDTLTKEKISTVIENEKLICEDDLSPHNDNSYSKNNAAALALISACLVGFSGIVPLLILPSFKHNELRQQSKIFL